MISEFDRKSQCYSRRGFMRDEDIHLATCSSEQCCKRCRAMFSAFFSTLGMLNATKESQLQSTTVDNHSIRNVVKQVKGINRDRLVLLTLQQLTQPCCLVMISTHEVDGVLDL